MSENEKVIQIAVAAESENFYEKVYILTNKGRIFMTIDLNPENPDWQEVKLPDGIKV